MSASSLPLRTLHLFAGIGGGILGDLLLGHVPVGAVEIDDFCQKVLRARQRDGWFSDLEIDPNGDVRTFDGTKWRGRVDVVAGGFPCQDLSIAGKRKGFDGERSSLWFHMARIIDEVEPAHVFIENVPGLLSKSRECGRVFGDLAEMGYDANWGVLGAHQVGAFNRRDRIWTFGTHSDALCRMGERRSRQAYNSVEKWRAEKTEQDRKSRTWKKEHWELELDPVGIVPATGSYSDAIRTMRRAPYWTNKLAAIKAVGNCQVPAVVELAWNALYLPPKELRKDEENV